MIKKTFLRLVLVTVCFSILRISAQPIIQVDSPDVNLGSIKMGTVDKIEYEFKIKNTGDQPLIINRVKPG
jgi:hypothetical protein